ncbi:acetyltransferase GNAT family [Vibrio ponticus]|nr:acetyltransferase GNAT family [Vibrio ponticus]
MSIEYFECPPESVPMALLLEADPSEESIRSYLAGSWCFVAKEKEVVLAVCVVKPIQTAIVEIFNVAVLPERQQQGIGSVLLRYTLQQLRHKG